jgi:hypothetical protein
LEYRHQAIASRGKVGSAIGIKIGIAWYQAWMVARSVTIAGSGSAGGELLCDVHRYVGAPSSRPSRRRSPSPSKSAQAAARENPPVTPSWFDQSTRCRRS